MHTIQLIRPRLLQQHPPNTNAKMKTEHSCNRRRVSIRVGVSMRVSTRVCVGAWVRVGVRLGLA